MATPDLTSVWTVLTTERPSSGISAVGTGHSVSAGEVLAGIDHLGRRQVLIPLLPGEAVAGDETGQAVHALRIRHDNAQYLSFVCLKDELATIFAQFAGELVVSLVDAPSPARTAIQLLARWRALFSAARPADLLSDEALIGLFGELLTVKQLCMSGASGELAWWTGPSGHQHDFRTSTFALEVKATQTREGLFVSISSVDQLDTHDDVGLYLVHYRFNRDPNGLNLHDLVEQIEEFGVDETTWTNLLNAAGIPRNSTRDYDHRRFRLSASKVYQVDQDFPQIVPASFAGGKVPLGTLRLSYVVDLTNEPPKPLSDAATVSLFDAVAEETHALDS